MQEIKLKLKGLSTRPNIYGEAGEGSMVVADNVVCDRPGVITPRRGFSSYVANNGAGVNTLYQPTSITEYKGSLIVSNAAGSLLKVNDADGTVSSFGMTANGTVNYAQASGNLFLTTDIGVQKLSGLSGQLTAAGVPPALEFNANTVAGTWLESNYSVAYQAIWAIRDSSGNLLLGTPSPAVIIKNGSVASGNTSLSGITIPQGVTESHFLQLYRTKSTPTSSPSSELYLCYEKSVTAGEIAAGILNPITDQTPNAALGPTLYTSPSQEGALAANYQPPFAADIASFNNMLFYANTKTAKSLTIQLLGLVLADGDTIKIGSNERTYIAKNTPTDPMHFTRSASTDAGVFIGNTARDLVRCINADALSSVYAFYSSSSSDFPGRITLRNKITSSAGVPVRVSRADAWSLGSAVTQGDDWANGLYWSKLQQPEAVPLLNYARVGSSNNQILRIMALRDSLFVFKENEGIYRVTGSSPDSISVSLFDSSANLVAPKTLAILNNQIWGLFDQGVCSVSETGVSIASQPIEDQLLTIRGLNPVWYKQAWGMSYESDRKYYLHVPKASGSSDKTEQCFVYNFTTNTWTRWLVSKLCGIVRPSKDLIYAGNANKTLSVERKKYDFTDFADEEFQADQIVMINPANPDYADQSSVSSSISLALYPNTAVLAAGDIIKAGQGTVRVVSATKTGEDQWRSYYTVQLENPTHFDYWAQSYVLKAYTSTVKLQPLTGGNPIGKKHFKEVSLLFEKRPSNFKLTFDTEISPSPGTVTLPSKAQNTWGGFSWGASSWNDTIKSARNYRAYVTRDHQRACILNLQWDHQGAYTDWALSGLSVSFTGYTAAEKVSK